MNFSNEKIIQRLQSGEALSFLFFWGHQATKEVTKSCFSQWYEAPFLVHEVPYATAEHFMMAQKALLFEDRESHERISKSTDPKEVKALGRGIKGFNQNTWEENRLDIVVRGNFHKFWQHKEMAQFLLNTVDQILVEASPADSIWGIGMAQDHKDAPYPWKWKGLNLLGYALMEVRTLLAALEADGPLNNPVLPPWLAYPEIERYSIGWRMGYGEDHMMLLSDYWKVLSSAQKKVYGLIFPARGEWKGWYED